MQRIGRSSPRGMQRKPRRLTQPAAARRAFAAREAMPRKRATLTLSELGVRDRNRAVLEAFELQLV